jgi:putative DNA primase/helicase
MQRKMPGEKCERLRELNAAEYRKRCGDFVQQHSAAIASARPEIPASLNDRAADIWEPLLAIADLAGGEWPQLARQAAVKLSGNVDDEMSLLGYFLKDLRSLMLLKKVDRMLSRDIVSILNPMHSRPWEDLRRGREINEYWLGHKMRELGIRSRSMRVGEANAKGYLLEDVEGAYRRYVNPELQSTQQLNSKAEGGTG